ncbi:hypothetical protein [Polyangium jinanense]|uniref:Uncharacterized protein n=1 Tax=Polyangium jinanense TaxID=2829994 RepID=A0A9X3X1L7_9BACT|nr:hypothetical protein [Polyangium jinanense]MDC3954052.1 hypothetical protein [Polyangium jinanense]MDC3981992.1 hypothetical protein [Polyangium jinanense]
MPDPIFLRFRATSGENVDVPVLLAGAGEAAAERWKDARRTPGVHVLLEGDRDYAVSLTPPASEATIQMLQANRKKSVRVIFPGRTPVRRRIADVAVVPPKQVGRAAAPGAAAALDLTAGREGAPSLWLLPDGSFATEPGPPPRGLDAGPALVRAARWVSSRRTTTFERLFPPSAFHPDEPLRPERLTAPQAAELLAQARSALAAAATNTEYARNEPLAAAQIRSAALTVLSHLVATALRDPEFRAAADQAAALMFAIVAGETGPSAMPALRAHAIQLLSMRAPALSAADRELARSLVRSLVREAPPYDKLAGPFRFAMCSARDFHEGEVDIFIERYGFREIPAPEGSPKPPKYTTYRVLEAPFRTPSGDPVWLYARVARPDDENIEMADPTFVGVFINRHAQLGAYDMRAATATARQAGYKIMMNAQCAGLTTRFAIARAFPDADIYSSWDSTYFRNGGPDGKMNASEGVDCFVELLRGMCEKETHAEIEARMRRVQWHHAQAHFPGFSQFVGPGNPLVVARFQDVNRDGRADLYDGFLDLTIAELAEDLRASLTPRDPGVAPSQIGGEAATGLGWAAGSMNRVTQYSDLWAGLPGQSELFYIFHAGGFYDRGEPPADVPGGLPGERLGALPAVCRYVRGGGSGAELGSSERSPRALEEGPAGMQADVMMHAHLSHAGKELKRLLCAADAMWRAFDTGLLDGPPMHTPAGKRGAILLTLAGLLEFPADQNFVDGLWSMALEALRFPPISRSVVRGCITEADHEASNYYGSRRGLVQLLEELGKSDPLALSVLESEDPKVGRAKEI